MTYIRLLTPNNTEERYSLYKLLEILSADHAVYLNHQYISPDTDDRALATSIEEAISLQHPTGDINLRWSARGQAIEPISLVPCDHYRYNMTDRTLTIEMWSEWQHVIPYQPKALELWLNRWCHLFVQTATLFWQKEDNTYVLAFGKNGYPDTVSFEVTFDGNQILLTYLEGPDPERWIEYILRTLPYELSQTWGYNLCKE